MIVTFIALAPGMKGIRHHDTQDNGAQRNDNQNNDTEHKGLFTTLIIHKTQHN